MSYAIALPGVRSLEQHIRNLEGDEGLAQRRRVSMALVVVGQMLPEGAVKGGSAMALRSVCRKLLTQYFMVMMRSWHSTCRLRCSRSAHCSARASSMSYGLTKSQRPTLLGVLGSTPKLLSHRTLGRGPWNVAA